MNQLQPRLHIVALENNIREKLRGIDVLSDDTEALLEAFKDIKKNLDLCYHTPRKRDLRDSIPKDIFYYVFGKSRYLRAESYEFLNSVFEIDYDCFVDILINSIMNDEEMRSEPTLVVLCNDFPNFYERFFNEIDGLLDSRHIKYPNNLIEFAIKQGRDIKEIEGFAKRGMVGNALLSSRNVRNICDILDSQPEKIKDVFVFMTPEAKLDFVSERIKSPESLNLIKPLLSDVRRNIFCQHDHSIPLYSVYSTLLYSYDYTIDELAPVFDYLNINSWRELEGRRLNEYYGVVKPIVDYIVEKDLVSCLTQYKDHNNLKPLIDQAVARKTLKDAMETKEGLFIKKRAVI